ncbi:hypothetical protein B0H14DRAFT_2652738 [Mycena olivaceomarginata]|nr:hypothetical protein B0H14DRAFT_2652738 [Mycena olivaceomarginata]
MEPQINIETKSLQFWAESYSKSLNRKVHGVPVNFTKLCELRKLPYLAGSGFKRPPDGTESARELRDTAGGAGDAQRSRTVGAPASLPVNGPALSTRDAGVLTAATLNAKTRVRGRRMAVG